MKHTRCSHQSRYSINPSLIIIDIIHSKAAASRLISEGKTKPPDYKKTQNSHSGPISETRKSHPIQKETASSPSASTGDRDIKGSDL